MLGVGARGVEVLLYVGYMELKKGVITGMCVWSLFS